MTTNNCELLKKKKKRGKSLENFSKESEKTNILTKITLLVLVPT